jgi:F0F1-type ATP synthase membrane subunit c/vacuolar-type H+-ATPase subunit K
MNKLNPALFISFGVAIGAGIGVALGNVGVGAGLGTAFGLIFCGVADKKKRAKNK